jgi:hypothetical protein
MPNAREWRRSQRETNMGESGSVVLERSGIAAPVFERDLGDEGASVERSLGVVRRTERDMNGDAFVVERFPVDEVTLL